jgi:hypothetical protein
MFGLPAWVGNAAANHTSDGYSWTMSSVNRARPSVRHIHDLALLKSRALGHRDFFTLVMAAMQTDAARPKNKPELETMPPTEKLQLMLQILSDDKQYAPEYERFVGGVSYATADKIPHFGTALAAVRELVSVV